MGWAMPTTLVMTKYTSAGSYKQTQTGTLIIIAMVVLFGITIGMGCFVAQQFFITAPLLAAWLFGSLTIAIGERDLRWHFGPGLVHKNVLLADIVSATPVRTNVFHGWGIHLTGYGWLYNVSGFEAVAITLRNGKCFALGTEEPQKLVAELTRVIQQNQKTGFIAPQANL
jgi:hypothetical protein